MDGNAMLPAMANDNDFDDANGDDNSISIHTNNALNGQTIVSDRETPFLENTRLGPARPAPRERNAPFVKDNICLKVNNQQVYSSGIKLKNSEKNNTSYQTLGNVYSSAKFG